ncbi:hypothetical protein Lal_00011064 [Lupinus albus]|uniref:Putative thioredoxin-like protein n=1 Tax=Lupinus albus TaxID=3870 RepID=A0A6A4PSV7_LUPAL|nr:putative thioredoxin-like protein [Lupinus albus]KAF1892597.1 hypothetical protein Lal_00011064 [Lupinus albus]
MWSKLWESRKRRQIDTTKSLPPSSLLSLLSLSLSSLLSSPPVSPYRSSVSPYRSSVSPYRSPPGKFSYSSFKDIDTLREPEPGSPPKSPSIFRKLNISKSLIHSIITPAPTHIVQTQPNLVTCPPYSDNNTIVLYFTTLRVVRRTYEDCCVVRSILKGFGVAIDERDVSIDSRFRDELRVIMGRWNVTLPCVFIGGKYIGNAEDVMRLYNKGQLYKLVEWLPRSKVKGCDFCGGLRFVVCDVCDGSHKLFSKKNGFITRTCETCNTNGLIRCHACFFEIPPHIK